MIVIKNPAWFGLKTAALRLGKLEIEHTKKEETIIKCLLASRQNIHIWLLTNFYIRRQNFSFYGFGIPIHAPAQVILGVYDTIAATPEKPNPLRTALRAAYNLISGKK